MNANVAITGMTAGYIPGQRVPNPWNSNAAPGPAQLTPMGTCTNGDPIPDVFILTRGALKFPITPTTNCVAGNVACGPYATTASNGVEYSFAALTMATVSDVPCGSMVFRR